MDKAPNQWLRAVLAKSVRISGPLKTKAEETAWRLGTTDFVATDHQLSVMLKMKALSAEPSAQKDMVTKQTDSHMLCIYAGKVSTLSLEPP